MYHVERPDLISTQLHRRLTVVATNREREVSRRFAFQPNRDETS